MVAWGRLNCLVRAMIGGQCRSRPGLAKTRPVRNRKQGDIVNDARKSDLQSLPERISMNSISDLEKIEVNRQGFNPQALLERHRWIPGAPLPLSFACVARR